LKSLSRTVPRAADPAFLPVINRAARGWTYADMELIRLGAIGRVSAQRSIKPSACTGRWRNSSPK
jgi:flagellum-specific ATP synthase